MRRWNHDNGRYAIHLFQSYVTPSGPTPAADWVAYWRTLHDGFEHGAGSDDRWDAFMANSQTCAFVVVVVSGSLGRARRRIGVWSRGGSSAHLRSKHTRVAAVRRFARVASRGSPRGSPSSPFAAAPPPPLALSRSFSLSRSRPRSAFSSRAIGSRRSFYSPDLSPFLRRMRAGGVAAFCNTYSLDSVTVYSAMVVVPYTGHIFEVRNAILI